MERKCKAVLFDLDGVLTTDKTGLQSTLRALRRHTGLPEEPLRTAYYRRNRAMLDGLLTHRAIWPEMCAEVGQEIPFDLLYTTFIETPMDADMLARARDLCGLYRPNVARRDERAALCAVFRKVWLGFDPDPEAVICDGCACDVEGRRCSRRTARRGNA